MPPYLTRRAPWFSFLVHPRDSADVRRFDVAPFLRQYCADDAELERKACSMPPLVLAEIRFAGQIIHGELVAVCRMPEEVVAPGGRAQVEEAVEVAVRRGARVIGLGALTSPVTGGGQTLVGALPRGVTVTNGNAYTAAVVRHNVAQAVACVADRRPVTVAVVGCTGSVGVAASHLLAELDDVRLVLVGRNERRARRLLPELAGRATFTGDLGAVSEADVAVMLTGDPSARLGPDVLRPGAVVIDCAQPPNVPADERALFRRHGVTVVEGGLVHMPGFHCGYDFCLGGCDIAFACLAETFLFAREGLTGHSVGRPSPDLARRLERSARRRGIRPRRLPLGGDGTAAAPPRPATTLTTKNVIG